MNNKYLFLSCLLWASSLLAENNIPLNMINANQPAISMEFPAIDMNLLAVIKANNQTQSHYFINLIQKRIKYLMIYGTKDEKKAAEERVSLFKTINRSLESKNCQITIDSVTNGLGIIQHIIEQQTHDQMSLSAIQNILWDKLLSCRSKSIPLVTGLQDNEILLHEQLIKEKGQLLIAYTLANLKTKSVSTRTEQLPKIAKYFTIFSDLAINLTTQKCNFIMRVHGDKLNTRLSPIKNWMKASQLEMRFILIEANSQHNELSYEKDSPCNNMYISYTEKGNELDYTIELIHTNTSQKIGVWRINELNHQSFSNQLNNLINMSD